MSLSRKPLFLIVALFSLLASVTGVRHQPPPAVHAAPARDFVGVIGYGDPRAISRLGVSWYLAITLNFPTAPDLKRAQLIQLQKTVDLDALKMQVAANPGGAWLVGNEPNVQDLRSSDSISPEKYATLLHAIEPVIHGADPSALVVGPAVLNWDSTCSDCGGFQSGLSWTQAFYDAYAKAYGTRPPIDRWAIHTYELNWNNTPTLHADVDFQQLTDLRAWLDANPAEAGRPIWDTEIGYHWAFPGWRTNDAGKVEPTGPYDTAGAVAWLNTVLTWLANDGQALGVERSFFYAQDSGADYFATVYGGLKFFDGGALDAPLTPLGQALKAFFTPADQPPPAQ